MGCFKNIPKQRRKYDGLEEGANRFGVDHGLACGFKFRFQLIGFDPEFDASIFQLRPLTSQSPSFEHDFGLVLFESRTKISDLLLATLHVVLLGGVDDVDDEHVENVLPILLFLVHLTDLYFAARVRAARPHLPRRPAAPIPLHRARRLVIALQPV